MQPVFQRIMDHNPAKGRYGDCFTACVATITGIPYDEFPVLKTPDWDLHYLSIRNLLNTKGWCITWFESLTTIHTGRHPIIASGKSPRGDYDHAVIVQHGELAHDPYPGGNGLDGAPKLFELIVPFDDLHNRAAIEPAGGCPSDLSSMSTTLLEQWLLYWRSQTQSRTAIIEPDKGAIWHRHYTRCIEEWRRRSVRR